MEPGSTIETEISQGRELLPEDVADRLEPELRGVVGADTTGRPIRPPIEVMKTIRPRAARIGGSIACVTATWAVRLTSTWRRKSSIGSVSSGPGTAMPALLTKPVEPSLPHRLSDLLGGSGDLPGDR